MSKSNNGFTLIELIVGLAILSLIVATLFPMLVAGLNYIATAGKRTNSTFLNQSQIETVLNQKGDILSGFPLGYVPGEITVNFPTLDPITSTDTVVDEDTGLETTIVKGYLLDKNVMITDGREVVYYFYYPLY